MIEIFGLATRVCREFAKILAYRDPPSCSTIFRFHTKFVSTGSVADKYRLTISLETCTKAKNCAGNSEW